MAETTETLTLAASRACEECGRPRSVRSGRKFCSRQCMSAAFAKPYPLKPCAQCGATVQPRIFPSAGRTESPSTYAKRIYCSADCQQQARRGVATTPPVAGPEKSCEVCERPMLRHRHKNGRLESMARFLDRKTCSVECGIVARSIPLSRDPAVVGPRHLLARTCLDCSELKPGEAFAASRSGYRSRRCRTCWAVRYAEQSSDERIERDAANHAAWWQTNQSSTAPLATHHGEEWTGPQLELIATRDDLSKKELALMLGRTYSAVTAARHRATRDPKWMKVAGVEDA